MGHHVLYSFASSSFSKWMTAAISIAGAVLLLTLPGLQAAQRQSPTRNPQGPGFDQKNQTFVAKDGHFLLDGKPYQVISGEMHYARIPRADWRLRLRMAKAMGLNTITTYVFWNIQEPAPGVFDFSGNRDVAEFIRQAQQEGLHVILRPGPYVCAEWDFGGLPSWLLKDQSMAVRTSNPAFIGAATRYMDQLGKQLAPLQIGNGGPIILVQVENEYGSFGSDHHYMDQIRRMILDAGFTKAQLYTADGPGNLSKGAIPEIPAFINYGPGDARMAFAALKKFRPGQVIMTSEYWDGWFDHWGGKHAQTNAQQQAGELRWMLEQGASVSLYMFHGGTSFGWMNGANIDHKDYLPQVTSYDYDAPLDESGRPTPKYYLFRKTISEVTGIEAPPVPRMPAPIRIAAFPLTGSVSLWDTLPAPIDSREPLSMEDIGQSYGYILYRTELNGPGSGRLAINQLHDYARVYLDGKLAGVLERRLGQNSLTLNLAKPHSRLDILVENMGRVNFGPGLNDDRQGITRSITFNGHPVTGWEIYSLPMKAPWKLHFVKSSRCTGPCFYQAVFQVEDPGDAFLDTRQLIKGEVWLNGHMLGRFWNIGPQRTLYMPGVWLKKGTNHVVVFDVESAPNRTLQGLNHSILGSRVGHP